MEINATSQLAIPVVPEPAPRHATESDAVGGSREVRQPGRRHIQRDLKHLVRDIRHEIRGELAELRAEGDQDQKIAAVRTAFHEFRDQVQAGFHDAGRGDAFLAGAVPESLRTALADFTAALRVLNGAPIEESVPVTPDVTAGILLDVTV